MAYFTKRVIAEHPIFVNFEMSKADKRDIFLRIQNKFLGTWKIPRIS